MSFRTTPYTALQHIPTPSDRLQYIVYNLQDRYIQQNLKRKSKKTVQLQHYPALVLSFGMFNLHWNRRSGIHNLQYIPIHTLQCAHCNTYTYTYYIYIHTRLCKNVLQHTTVNKHKSTRYGDFTSYPLTSRVTLR